MAVGVFSFEGEWGSGYSSDRVMGLVLWWPEDGEGARYDGVGEAPMLREQSQRKGRAM